MMARDFNPRLDVEHTCLYCGVEIAENLSLEPRPSDAAEYEQWRHDLTRRRRLAGRVAWVEGPDGEGRYTAQVYVRNGTWGKHKDGFFCTDRCAIAFGRLAARMGARYRRRDSAADAADGGE
jgi:hypothetical protein